LKLYLCASDMSAAVSCQPESPLPIQETPLTFHPRAQRNAFRCPDARQQSRSFARWNESLRHSPNSTRLC
jgi:hypothetical protein